jgi:hypothetical protein
MRIVRIRSFVRMGVLASVCMGASVPAAGQQVGIAAIPADHRPPRIQLLPPAGVEGPERPAALMPLYVSLVALEGLDIHSTRRAIASGGGREANPAMAPVVGNSAAFLAVKAGATAGVIWASEKMWKRKRKASVIFAAVVNVAMAAIVANNYRVSARRH